MQSDYINIVCDIDGTLIPLGTSGYEHTTCTDRTVRAVRAAVARGLRFSIATGRKRSSASIVNKQLGANGDLICYQGAMIVSGDNNEVLVHERIEPDVAASAIELFMSHGIEIRVYLDGEIWLTPNGHESVFVARRPSSEYKTTSNPVHLAESRPTTIVGVDHPARVGNHVSEIEALLGDSALVTRSLAHFCEVGSPNAGKVKALDWLVQHRGLDRRRTVAFGDGMGDVEMLNWAGLGIAVGTDIPEVLDAADESIPGPEEDGVAQWIEDLIANR